MASRSRDPYAFKPETKSKCWEKHATLLDRDPERWRRDVDGKAVLHWLENKEGICGYRYSHITPVAKADTLSKSEKKKLPMVDNCEVLRSSAYRRKMNTATDPVTDLMCDIDLNDAEKNVVQMNVYGSVTDGMGRKICKCISEADRAGGMYRGNVLPCEHPVTSRNLCNEMRERLTTMLNAQSKN